MESNIKTMEWRTNKLIDLLKCYIKRGDFTLASGQKSNLYIDCKSAMTSSILNLEMICAVISWKIQEELRGIIPEIISIDALAGIEFGAIPIVVGTCMYNKLRYNWNMKPIIFRKEKKNKGLKNSIEGTIVKGDNIIILEDVVTTGQSVLNIANKVKAIGGNVIKIISIVDRNMGGKELLNTNNNKYNYHPLVSINDLI